MPSKRDYSEMPQEGIHAFRQALVEMPTSEPGKARRVNTSKQTHSRPANPTSVNAIKTRIRDITRRLERLVDLPADIRAEDERALAAYQLDLAAAMEEKTKQKMIKKYHMVRFFERQKATRAVKKFRKLLIEATDPAEVERLKNELHVADVDLNYTQYSPLNGVYISLYPQNVPLEKKPEMWFEVEKRMEEGGLDQLRNGTRPHFADRPKASIAQPKPRPLQLRPKPTPVRTEAEAPAAAKPNLPKGMREDAFFKLNRREKRKVLRKSGQPYASRTLTGDTAMGEAEDGNDSDGGFFEE